VIDGAGWYRSRALKAPELNPIAQVWDELRKKYSHNRIFKSLKVCLALAAKPRKQDPNKIRTGPEQGRRHSAWSWILAAFLGHLLGRTNFTYSTYSTYSLEMQ
jgi:hypothetical protein